MRSQQSHAYEVNLIPVWDYWVVEVPEACGVHALVADLGDAEGAARIAIATVLEVNPDDVSVVLLKA